MDTFEAIYGRRAVKHCHPRHEFNEEEIQELAQAAILLPTSFNMRNWRLVLVRDKALTDHRDSDEDQCL